MTHRMWSMKTKAVAALTVATLAATAAMPLPASAAPAARPAAVQAAAGDATTDFSSQRRARRGNNNAAAAAMFGVMAGTIATIAVNEQRRKRERNYWQARQGYYGHPGYYPPRRGGYFYDPGINRQPGYYTYYTPQGMARNRPMPYHYGY